MSSALDKLKAAAKKAKDGGDKSYGDGNQYFYPARDAAGNGSAVIRFLPGKTEDDLPWVKTYAHGFKGPTGRWFIEDCPTTIGDECPACAANSTIVAKYGKWDQVPEEQKNVVRERKRKMNYIANVYVVSDPKNPENEGRVMLFKFGAKIFDIIMGKLEPELEEDGPAVNVFDLLEGANFRFRIRKVKGQTNYDKSDFEEVSELGSKAQIKAAVDAMHDLNQFTAKSRFKDAAELQKKLDAALGNTVRMAESTASDDDVEDDDHEPEQRAPARPAAKARPASDDGDDGIDALMAKIAAESDDDIPF